MAKLSTPAIKPSTYRHFAVLTLACTLMLAIFSDGEKREAIAAGLEAQRQAEAARLAALEPKYGTPVLRQASRPDRFYDLEESRIRFGAPMDRNASQVQNIGDPGLPLASARLGEELAPQAYARFGISERELAALSPEERALLLARLRAGGLPLDPAERARRIKQLLAASAARSGGGGIE